jgi:alpha-L-fucosidase 2
LHLLRPDRPADRKLIETSLRTWETHTKEFRGYSYAGAASLHALLGQGDPALEDLNFLLDHDLKPNTFYADAGPIVGAPLAGATAIQEMLLQSWGNRVRVFPAMPAGWHDAAFASLRAEGGFLVSAVWHDSAVAWIRVEATAPGPCRLVVPGWTQAKVRSARRPDLAVAAGTIPGEFTFALGGKGGWVVLAASADSSLPKLTPVPRPAGSPAANPFPAHPSL